MVVFGVIKVIRFVKEYLLPPPVLNRVNFTRLGSPSVEPFLAAQGFGKSRTYKIET